MTTVGWGAIVHVILLGSALAAGCLLAVQASVNQQLNKAVGTPYGASTVQLSVAAGALALVAAAGGVLGAVAGVGQVEPGWLLLGGLASPLYITAGILLFPRLGALTSVGLFVTGQVFASLALDTFGLLSVPRQPLSPGIAVGAALVLTGITVVIRGQKMTQALAPASTRAASSTSTISSPNDSARLGWIVLGLLAGAGLPAQGAVNAQLRQQIDAPLAVGTISFTVATVAIAVVLVTLLALGRTPTPRFKPLGSMPWWGWLGGLCAAAYVIATFLLIPSIGAAVTIALTVTGQQAASALIDQFGWLGMARRALTAPRLIGLGLLIGGSVLVQLH